MQESGVADYPGQRGLTQRTYACALISTMTILWFIDGVAGERLK